MFVRGSPLAPPTELTVCPAERQRGRLAVELRLAQRIARLVEAARLLDARAQLLGQQFEAARRLVQQDAKRAVGLLQQSANNRDMDVWV